MQINRDNTRENKYRVDYDYKVRDKVMPNNHAVYKYEPPYRGKFVIRRSFANGTVKLYYVPTKIRCNIRRINPYKSDTNIKDIRSKNIFVQINT